VLKWLEELEPPVVAVPFMTKGQRVKNYVPNNDLDAKEGDPRRIGEIRTDKVIRPWLFDGNIPLLYVWELCEGEESERMARAACELAEHLYQFGRGVDLAWAWGERLHRATIDERLRIYAGQVFRPCNGGNGTALPCPTPGSLASLKARHAAGAQRFTASGNGRQLFSQQPKPRFAQVAYDSPPSRHVFELRTTGSPSSLSAWPLTQASRLVVLLRNRAVERLRNAMPQAHPDIESVLVGRRADGANAAPAETRIRIVPLPSIGSQYADHGIRRVLVEVPASCPLRGEDVRWGFSGLDVTDDETGEVVLTPSASDSMLLHYCARANQPGFRVWRTVTPAVLPEAARRRRIDPAQTRDEAKAGTERAAEQARAAAEVWQSLRHAQIAVRVDSIRVQREPFGGRGARVEAFAFGTRFEKHRLWHVEVNFSSPIRGPLVIGDGRFLGLGVMEPATDDRGVHAFLIESGLRSAPDPSEIARSLRRAVMARVQERLGVQASLPRFFTGHEPNGAPSRTEHQHLTFVFDPKAQRLLIMAPHVFERRAPTLAEAGYLAELDAALAHFRELRVSRAGTLILRACSIASNQDPMFAASQIWESTTPYLVTRHSRGDSAAEALATDLRAECRRQGLPEPKVTARRVRGQPGVGLAGEARLVFEVAVHGPLVLGRTRHLGGGLFSGSPSAAGAAL
jgi:CRISPR-associated protein Csb2